MLVTTIPYTVIEYANTLLISVTLFVTNKGEFHVE